MTQLSELLQQDAVTVAKKLLGYRFYHREEDGSLTGGIIIETEAYNQDDAASHSYKGKTPRTEVMFGPGGYLYVYFTYGMHWCANIVVGPEGRGEAVLLRALRLDRGIEKARERRNYRPDSELTNGPAKLCQALNITGSNNGAKLGGEHFILAAPETAISPSRMLTTTRIGISKDTHRLWRFVLKDG